MAFKKQAKKLLKRLDGLDNCNDKISAQEREYFELEYIERAFEEIKNEVQKEFIDLLNHNKGKIFKGEDRDVNEIFLDLEFLRELSKQ